MTARRALASIIEYILRTELGDRDRLTILQVITLLVGVLSVPANTLLIRSSVGELGVSKRVAHGFDQETVSVNTPRMIRSSLSRSFLTREISSGEPLTRIACWPPP